MAKEEKKFAEKKEDSFPLEPEPVEFRYKIASKVLENGVRMVTYAKGLYRTITNLSSHLPWGKYRQEALG